jgi:hypothetical protein
MEGLKRITPGEAENYTPLNIYDPNVCTRAVAFILLPSPIPNPGGSPWEDITYYANPDYSIDQYPLEIMLEEWKMSSNIDPRNSTG